MKRATKAIHILDERTGIVKTAHVGLLYTATIRRFLPVKIFSVLVHRGIEWIVTGNQVIPIGHIVTLKEKLN